MTNHIFSYYNYIMPHTLRLKQREPPGFHAEKELLVFVEKLHVDVVKNIAENKPSLPMDAIHMAAYRIISSMVFMRLAETRGIESEGLLLSAARAKNIHKNLVQLFRQAGKKYNSAFFAQVDGIDCISATVLRKIINVLYAPGCPFDLSVVPIEILGSIYEHFLETDGTAAARKKAQAKKAGGVYYTSQHIVDYIVRRTVGRKIKNKTPDEISRIKICDPACGCGAFLLGAYHCLANYHFEYYTQAQNIKAAIKKGNIRKIAFQSYQLTLNEKLRIMANNIFGVDIDINAIEITRLSLYLALLENAGEMNVPLLSLENNIKCGNSLVGFDFYSQSNYSNDGQISVNCFDWEREYPEIFENGGFDAVIGNPPYCNYSARNSLFKYYEKNGMKKEYEHLATLNDYCKKKYSDSSKDVADIYKWFIQKATEIKNRNGCIGFIIPDTFVKLESYRDVRELLKNNYEFKAYGFDVFKNAAVSSGVLIFPGRIKHLKKKNENIFSVQTGVVLRDIAKFREGEHIPRTELSTNTALMPVTDSKDMGRYYTGPSAHYYKRKSAFAITSGNRIIIRKTGYAIVASLVSGESYVIQNLYQSVVIQYYSEKYILALLNSQFLTKYYRNILNPDSNGAFAQFRLGELYKLPLPCLDLSVKADKIRHDKLVSLADAMLELRHREAAEHNERRKALIAKQIAAVDSAIDAAVYGLYNVTGEDLAAVNGI